MKPNDLLGWAASLILLLTILFQIHKQIQSRSAEGVSRFLFIGQIVASVGLALYSYNLGNWVFTALNVVMICTNCVGFYFTNKFKKEKQHAQ
jgi:uncharacterized protein with PQ loop repeat